MRPRTQVDSPKDGGIEMTAKRNTVKTRRGVKKLKLKKETVKDLDVKSRAKEVKGGMLITFILFPLSFLGWVIG